MWKPRLNIQTRGPKPSFSFPFFFFHKTLMVSSLLIPNWEGSQHSFARFSVSGFPFYWLFKNVFSQFGACSGYYYVSVVESMKSICVVAFTSDRMNLKEDFVFGCLGCSGYPVTRYSLLVCIQVKRKELTHSLFWV